MNPKPGEVYLVDLGIAGKVRPVVVVSREDPNSPRAIAVCVPFTTQCRNSPYEVALGKWSQKETWANVQGIMAIGHEKLGRRLGSLSPEQMVAVRKALAFALGL